MARHHPLRRYSSLALCLAMVGCADGDTPAEPVTPTDPSPSVTTTEPTTVTTPTTSVVVRPNILLIMADDFGEESLDAYGDTSWDTPVIDQLADEGLRFDTVWATPICTPSRVELMSGLYPFRTGWNQIIAAQGECLDPSLAVLSQTLQQSGYRTAMAGKWQLCRWDEHPTNLNDAGFDEAFVWSWRIGDGRPNRYYDPGIWWNDSFDEKAWVGTYGPDLYSQHLIDFMVATDDQPFFAYYPMILPHSPYLAPPDHPEVDPALDDPAHFGWMVRYMDEVVGRLLTALDQAGLRDNTIVIFTGDNGNDRVLETTLDDGTVVVGGKGTMGEPGVQVPLIVHWPGHIGPEVREDLVDFTDLMPTVVELTGTPPPAGDGRSIAGWIDPSLPVPVARTHMFTEYGDGWAIRDVRWKLEWTGELYDLDADPHELSPILEAEDTPDSASQRAALQLAHTTLINSPSP